MIEQPLLTDSSLEMKWSRDKKRREAQRFLAQKRSETGMIGATR
jgi:hypothetical protein